MSKIDNPMFGKVGAFWVEGKKEPFYGITEAKQYQYDQGGDVLNFRGKVAIHDPEPNIAICSKCGIRVHGKTTDEANICEDCAPPPPGVKKETNGFWSMFGMG